MAKKAQFSELGFGTLAAKNGQRFMNSDGSANVIRKGGPWLSASDVFHKLTTMKSSKFLLVVFVFYILANGIFASLYLLCGIESIGATKSGNLATDFLEAFFFSTQCYTTIGFGRMNPISFWANVVASIEGLVGLLSIAIATGLIYGRFSRPRAHLLHSNNLIIAPYLKTKRAVMFRIASTRKHSILIENSVSVSLGINLEESGEIKRRFFVLNLEIPKINFLNLSWTLVHPITEESPLWGLNHDDLIKGRAEFIILFKAMEETTSQTVIERFSYFGEEIVWGAKFISAIGTTSTGQSMLDINQIHGYELVDLPPIIAPNDSEIAAQIEPINATSDAGSGN